MSWGTAIYNWYVRGKAVERATDQILDRVAHNSNSPESRTRGKVAAYWIGSSMVVVAAVNPVVPVAAGCAIGIAGLIPFVRPLYCGTRAVISNLYGNNPLYRRVQLAALWALFGGVQAVSTWALSQSLSTNAAVPASFAVSTMTVGGALYFSGNPMVHPQRESSSFWTEAMDKALESECVAMRQQERQLRAQLEAIDKFVEDNPALRQATLEAYQKDRENIAGDITVPPTISDDPDLITRRTNLRVLMNRLEHCLTERMEFFERNPNVLSSLKKHLAALGQPIAIAMQPVRTGASGATIELLEEGSSGSSNSS